MLPRVITAVLLLLLLTMCVLGDGRDGSRDDSHGRDDSKDGSRDDSHGSRDDSHDGGKHDSSHGRDDSHDGGKHDSSHGRDDSHDDGKHDSSHGRDDSHDDGKHDSSHDDGKHDSSHDDGKHDDGKHDDNKPRSCTNVDIVRTCLDLVAQFGADAVIMGDVDIIDNGTDEGICFLSHTSMGIRLPTPLLNGFVCNSQLCNYALFTTECSNGTWINLYEIMLPDIPGRNGEPSTTQIYVNALFAQGLDVAGFHFHWTGNTMAGFTMHAIHHQNLGLSPSDFVRKTLNALDVAAAEINRRTH